MRYRKYGLIVIEHIEKLPNRYLGTKIDVFCVMPNHIHMIIVLGYELVIRESPLRRFALSQMVGYLKSNTTKTYEK